MRTMSEIKQANREAGQHFFSAAAMRFFRSRIEGGAFKGGFFITSEQFDDSTPRRYTIRQSMESGLIATVGDFQGYRTREAAKEAIRELQKTK